MLAVTQHFVFGVTGWKNAGKTTLAERLVAEFVRRGWRVSTVKHAHHAVDIDRPGTNSFRHRAAGASRGGAGRRPALRHHARAGRTDARRRCWRGWRPPTSCWSRASSASRHPKIEVRAGDGPCRWRANDPAIVAIAADASPPRRAVPWFRRDDIAGIADFIAPRKG